MFEHPLWVASRTHFSLLGIPPEATADEVSDAIDERQKNLESEGKELDRQIKEVYDKTPGLKEAEEEVKTLRGQREAPERTHELEKDGLEGEGKTLRGPREEARPIDRARLAAAQKRLDEAEVKARRVNPEFRLLQRKRAEVEASKSALNSIGLKNTEQRRDYKRAHPPLDLLELSDCAREPFSEVSDVRTLLFQLRREAARFLASQGEEVYHPSDLTREDFTADFTPNELLDGRAAANS